MWIPCQVLQFIIILVDCVVSQLNDRYNTTALVIFSLVLRHNCSDQFILQDVVKNWLVGGNGRIRWSTNCEYPNVKYNLYTETKFLPKTKCGDHCLSIKRCTHFGYLLGMCFFKDYRGARIVQTSDKNIPICGFIPVSYWITPTLLDILHGLL